MNNQELELKIKEIIAHKNMFDMILAAKNFDKEYRTSDFYKQTKMPLMNIIKEAKMFYTVNAEHIKETVQSIINNIDMANIEQLFGKIGDVFEKENAETLNILGELQDFKDIVNK